MKAKLLLVLSFALTITAQAGSGTWIVNPVNNDWNTAANWSSNTVPGNPDTAFFGVSNITELSATAGANVGVVIFTMAADAYQITAPPGQFFVVENGLSNESMTEQQFVAAVDSAGDSGSIQLNGGTVTGSEGHFRISSVASAQSAV